MANWQSRDRKQNKRYALKIQKRFYNEPKNSTRKETKVLIREKRKEVEQEQEPDIDSDSN